MKEERKEKILSFISNKDYHPLKMKEIAMLLSVPTEDRDQLAEILDELEREGSIVQTKKGKYVLPHQVNFYFGEIKSNERGFAFFIPVDKEMEDVFIPPNMLYGALNGDKVYISIYKEGNDERRAEGRVEKILERKNQNIVGLFNVYKDFAFVTPDNKRINGDIYVAKSNFNGAQNNQKVVVRITKWAEGERKAEGEVVEIIGHKKDVGVDITSIAKSYDLHTDFPDTVIAEAKSITGISQKDKEGRKDFTNLQTVTIDGEDAKDLDDAITLEKLSDDRYMLGVHIADVSHYVQKGSQLDKEAYERGTSVYLVDRVIPMLPKELSNGICSLNMGEDRLAFSVMMEVDGKGNVLSQEICESVINVDERMTYTDVYKILEEDDKELKEKYISFLDMFSQMKELALILRAKREARGAIDFNFTETKVVMEDGKVVDVHPYEITIANSIIEEFMILCNETVSETFYWSDIPFVYRVHEDPDPEKIEVFAQFAHNLGYTLKNTEKIHPKELQGILNEAKGKKEERVISEMMLRSMQKAKYTSNNSRHFGLASNYYSHFTSPIRRYPDLLIHRIMKEYLAGTFDERQEAYYESRL